MQPPKLQCVPSIPLFAHCLSNRIGFYFDGVLQLLQIEVNISQADFDLAWAEGWQAGCSHRLNGIECRNSASAFVYQFAYSRSAERQNNQERLSVSEAEIHAGIPF